MLHVQYAFYAIDFSLSNIFMHTVFIAKIELTTLFFSISFTSYAWTYKILSFLNLLKKKKTIKTDKKSNVYSKRNYVIINIVIKHLFCL